MGRLKDAFHEMLEGDGLLGKGEPLDYLWDAESQAAAVERVKQKQEVTVTGTIEGTLAERGNRYGKFDEHARITQNIKRAMVDSPNWKALSDAQKEALEMVAHKVGRILNGDPNYHDSWHDMIGYTKLVADTLEGKASQ